MGAGPLPVLSPAASQDQWQAPSSFSLSLSLEWLTALQEIKIGRWEQWLHKRMISSDFCEEVTCKASNYNKSFLSSCSFISIGTYYALGAESSMEICSLHSHHCCWHCVSTLASCWASRRTGSQETVEVAIGAVIGGACTLQSVSCLKRIFGVSDYAALWMRKKCKKLLLSIN